jgi:predicted negative regulator of RcsB-dependent stress response
VELYDTEEQQVEAIKKWLNENGRSIVVGIAVGIGCVFGWNGWQSYQTAQFREASDLFQGMLEANQDGNEESVSKTGERIKENYGDSPYAVYASFFLAKQSVETGDLESARKELESILVESSEPAMKNLARVRLLKVLLAEGKASEALELMNGLEGSARARFEAAFQELKGDAYVALGQEREARTAYKRAIELGRKSRFLNLKIEDLPVPGLPQVNQ